MLENSEDRMLWVSFSDEKNGLQRIKKYASELIQFTRGMDFEEYQKNVQVNYACAFALLQIGTIGNRLASDVQLKLEIPWRAIVAARNASLHGHSHSHKEIIWNEIKNISTLLLKLDAILE
jgi:uncharacterized protein with HEPN domain